MVYIYQWHAVVFWNEEANNDLSLFIYFIMKCKFMSITFNVVTFSSLNEHYITSKKKKKKPNTILFLHFYM